MSQTDFQLLRGPALFNSQSTATTLVLPTTSSSSNNNSSTHVVSLSFILLPLPEATNQRPEHDQLLACQNEWQLIYSPAERRIRWIIQNAINEASFAMDDVRSSHCIPSSLRPSVTTSFLSAKDISPHHITHVQITHAGGQFGRTCYLRINHDIVSSIQLANGRPKRNIFESSPIHLGGNRAFPIPAASSAPSPSTRYNSFSGLISDVTYTLGPLAKYDKGDLTWLEKSALNDLTFLSSADSDGKLTLRQQLPVPPPANIAPIHSLQHLNTWNASGLERSAPFPVTMSLTLTDKQLLPGQAEGTVVQVGHAAEAQVSSYPVSENMHVAAVGRAVERSGKSSKRRVIHCHDMSGGYTEDSDSQHGLASFHGYNFQFWSYIDIFIYFSHARIAIPPFSWINAAHKEGVKILGNFCTEWTDGEKENLRLIGGLDAEFQHFNMNSIFPMPVEDGDESWKIYAHKLVTLAVYYRFDGWFMNVEAPLPKDDEATSSSSSISVESSSPSTPPPDADIKPCKSVVKLARFLSYLTECMHQAQPDSVVMWYDSVRASDGALKWQSRLNNQNDIFFKSCDAIFTDYHWQQSWPSESAAYAGADRVADVFTGVDLWGRGSYGGGGFDVVHALKIIEEANTSVALFAPAWSYESEGRKEKGREEFTRTERRLWLGEQLWSEVNFPQSSPVSMEVEANSSQWQFSYEKPSQGWSIAERDGSVQPKKYVWVTSHEWCRRTQKLDLLSQFTREQLDGQPAILISTEVCGTPPNCADFYELRVSLLDADGAELGSHTISRQLNSNGKWESIAHEFKTYGIGLRYLVWSDGGKDTEKWAGHFGTRIGDCSVRIKIPQPRSDSIVKYLPSKNKIPFLTSDKRCFNYSFNTGNGKFFFIEGYPQIASVIRPSNNAASSASPLSNPWLNLSLQDCQSILVDDYLCDGEVVRQRKIRVLGHECSVHAVASITHETAYDGGSCFQIELSMQPIPGAPILPPSSGLDDFTAVSFDLFEFGPPSPASSHAELQYNCQMMCQVPNDWLLSLCFLMSDKSTTIFQVRGPTTSSSENSWGRITTIPTLGASFDLHAVQARVDLQYIGTSVEAVKSPMKALFRIGQICITPHIAVAPLGSLSSTSSSIEFTKYLTMDSFVTHPQIRSFLFDWRHVDFSESNEILRPIPIRSYDVFVNEQWQARVLTKQYFLNALQPYRLQLKLNSTQQDALALVASSSATSHWMPADFKLSVRANYSNGFTAWEPFYIIVDL